jgi:hypothetical protein
MSSPMLTVRAGSAIVSQIPLASIPGYSFNHHSESGQGEKYAFTITKPSSQEAVYYFFASPELAKQAYDRLADALLTQTDMMLDIEPSLNEHLLPRY